MIKTKQEKHEFVKSFEQRIKEAKSFYLVGYQGLTVKELEDLRRKLRAFDANFNVIRNRLVSRVFNNASFKGFDEYLKGPVAIILENGDFIKLIKQLSIFSKANNKFKIKAGYADNRLLSEDDIKNIASLPSREQLLANVVGGIAAPMIGLVSVLSGPMRKLVIVLSAASNKKN
ncbi:MAG: 50S ribosomal protein L10 [Elusimicrobia bacterium RIFOXYD2_FULL_34_30]|nr:MAG: 50S ribosomal protein L10 [Elusimicrobia bacterium RIFOXYD2_FULL_34_30]